MGNKSAMDRHKVGGKRVLRLMRQHGLLAPRRLGPSNGNPAHDGTIITDRPDVMWGTDATRVYTEREGWCWFFGTLDHYTDEVVGWHVASGAIAGLRSSRSGKACGTPTGPLPRT